MTIYLRKLKNGEKRYDAVIYVPTPGGGQKQKWHTFGSLKLDQGEDLVYVSRQLDHADIAITASVYSHLIRRHRPEAAAKTDELLFGQES